jgi:hypothetical protein
MNYFSHYVEKAQSDLFASTGAFWAFGQKQFDEKKKEGVNYVSLGAGCVCPKDQVSALLDGLDAITAAGVKADVEENGAANIMRREYFNYECQITMDTSNAIGALSSHIKQFPELFTEEAMRAVFSNCFNEAVENDMF